LPDSFLLALFITSRDATAAPKERIEQWKQDYYDYLQYVKDAGYGKHMCGRCLLNGSRESYDLFGIRDKIVESLHDYVRNYRAELPSGDDCSLQYPCPIVDRLECPYQNNKRFNNAELVAAGGIVNTMIAALNDSSEPSTATSIFFENPAEVVDKSCVSFTDIEEYNRH
jgi:hypothetical protein